MGKDEAKIGSILKAIEPDRLTKLAVDMASIPSPKGKEAQVAQFILDWLKEEGFSAFSQEIAPGRNNVVAVLPGTGKGACLIFNGHIDTSEPHPEEVWVMGQERGAHDNAWLSQGRIYGQGVVNDKGPIAAFMVAAKAIKDNRIDLGGDLILTMVAGEINQAPVDEFQDTRYHGFGAGARHLIEQGVWGDYALVAETTDFALTWAETGCALFKITVQGRKVYTPFLNRPLEAVDNPNAIVKMARIVEAVEKWAYQYEQENQHRLECGLMKPKVNIGAIRGGLPYWPSVSAPLCSIYLDVRVTPGTDPLSIKKELEKVLGSTGVKTEIELYFFKPGSKAEEIKTLRSALERAHNYLFKDAPKEITPPQTSMWRDLNVFNQFGIPALTYGPGLSSGRDTDDVPFLLEADLLKAAQVYALTALYLCG